MGDRRARRSRATVRALLSLVAGLIPCNAYLAGSLPLCGDSQRPLFSLRWIRASGLSTRPFLKQSGGGGWGGGGGKCGRGGGGRGSGPWWRGSSDGGDGGGGRRCLAALPVGLADPPEDMLARIRGGGAAGGAFGEDFAAEDIPDVWSEKDIRRAIVTGANSGVRDLPPPPPPPFPALAKLVPSSLALSRSRSA